MNVNHTSYRRVLSAILMLGICSPLAAQMQTSIRQARHILDVAGIKGGLIVHIGCDEPDLTAALRRDDSCLVHGLAVDPDKVQSARKHIRSLGRYGPVSIARFDGMHLPYADNLVNLIVADGLADILRAECLRVLAPKGVLCIKSDDDWVATVKPRPETIDEWTHHLHDPGGNAVSSDQVTGPPRQIQWTAGPLWARSHGWTPSVSAMVSAGGRIFYICDQTMTGVDGSVPSRWCVVARDAFSGVPLWEVPIPKWGSRAFSGTPDAGHGITVGRFTMPPHVGKRLVAIGDTVYVTLGPTAAVTALDATTGQIRNVYKGTENTDEILCSDGRLILSINPPADAKPPVVEKDQTPPPAPGKHICAVDIETGRMLWKNGPFDAVRAGRGQDPFGRLELAAGDGKVFILTAQAIHCFDAASGDILWRIDRPKLPDDAVRRLGFAGMYEFLLTVMVYRDGVVLLAQPEPNTHHTYHTMPGTLYAFDADSGHRMWQHAYGGWGHCTPPDVFVVADNVWTHVNAETEFGSVWGNGYRALDSSKVDYRIQALNLRTGKLQREISTKDIFNVGHHHRCYRNKITERFLLSSRRGVEFVDLASGRNYQNHWVRSGCLLGYLPCNGLLYTTPHPCSCYIEAKLIGFNALAPARDPAPPIGQRLEKGPAYAAASARRTEPQANDWPTYRAGGLRSGATDCAVPTNLEIAWQTDIGAELSAPVVSNGKVYLACPETHDVRALDAGTGRTLWTCTADSRIDSPPTIHSGLAIFGSADGTVYCLTADTGRLVWRFTAAPHRRLINACNRLESPWPVPGSVLIHENQCWFAAGRSSYLDGGIQVYALDPATGKVLHHRTIYHPDPQTHISSPEPSAHAIAGMLNDVPATDGANVFIRQMQISSNDKKKGKPHLYTSGGYLDSSLFNRTYWQVGQARTAGLMVMGDDCAYGVEVYASRSRETVFTPGAGAYRLKCALLKAPPAASKPKRRMKEPPARWQQKLPIRVTALVRAADTLFAAGLPDTRDSHTRWTNGRPCAGALAAFDAETGKAIEQYKLPAPPVWDGMAAANGRLYISTDNGRILCMRPEDAANN